MKQLRTEVHINAPTTVVWQILRAFEEYPSWNPFVVHIEGDLKLAGNLKTTMMLNGKAQHFAPKVMALEPGKKFEWLGKMPLGLFNGHHYFHLEPIGAEQTKFIHGEHFSGLLRGLIMRMIGAETLRSFEAMNAALKARAEAWQ
ncbi:MAG: SRPBCC domain-containing protein [Phaeodactylibacter sp.]|nr:SRPBCC domain-containing protein [Phaeodactylibacter sp.]